MAARRYSLVLVAFVAMAPACHALVIDDFSAGPAESVAYSPETPNIELLDLLQQELPDDSVLGGARNLEFLHGGRAAVSTSEGVLRMTYDRLSMEIASFDYSRSTTVPQLNADFTANGDDHLLIRVTESRLLGPQSGPSRVSLFLQSNEGESTSARHFGEFELIDSSTPYTIAIPFDLLSESSEFDESDVDLTDIDQISFSFLSFSSGFIDVAIDAIATGSLTPGDLNADGLVSETDLNSFGAHYGVTASFLAADANKDGVVNAADYTVWRDAAEALGTSAPEPTTFVLAVVGFQTLIPRSARR